MSRKSDLIKSIYEVEKLLEDLEMMRRLLQMHLETGTPKVREVYDNVSAEIQRKEAIRQRLKYALALEEQEDNDSSLDGQR